MPNRNILYATTLVDELARAGLRHVCLAPGSRNTPLVLAFARHPAIRVFSHLDERSAAFFALGLALATDTPAAVVCTSGSAAANFFPAIVEAHQAGVPLLALTADRPHELRDSGANQTIDQVKMFGSFARWSVDVALPEAMPPPVALRNLRTLAARAMAIAGGEPRGVVHLNLPFRPPLEPTPMPGDLTEPPAAAQPRDDGAPYTCFLRSAPPAPPEAVIEPIAAVLEQHERGLIVCGPRCPGGAFGALVSELSQRTGYPALVDGVSGVRFGYPGVIGGYETFLFGEHAFPPPEVVLRFGAVLTSKWLNQYLDTAASPVVIHVRASGVWADDSHRVSHFVVADEAAFIRALIPRLTERQSAWRQRFVEAEARVWAAVEAGIADEPYFDGGAVYDVIDLLPEGASLFVGNSLPVRHLDQFGKPGVRHICAFANRGASGIDGNISTALGIGAGRPDAPLAAIVGDITFYHDMNGLLAVRRCGVPATIVLLNNDGGGIFHRLPINRFEPEFTDYFVTPHGLDFAHAAKMYGLEYVPVKDRTAFRSAFRASIDARAATLIELRTDARTDLVRRNALIQAARATGA
ncbi:2-succinyl-5-enolpyruvyl-6-hydroxy-3-cyclohexene-1-carboxylic-acid synthase [Roseiflexus castenholzii]|uniref:2-succinyl-5-enolpyruvyl-6-hydroxy-3-cyclohexene-1-carboxylate synthase n=1 Tax=Roseiflexus castenholzii (strain DSM 13941 / HLO8) TaxID=383372 RepID=MEND_ROSCS|nr:2-succinyl-5-enolpyruvyl-6-hydroxy-3-cyclohexene-1-carboxylic-acid synthase [Roseiflexus castenholzii]A7NRP8.1 RecName: Full=2-succinyl-5-enolpyruvyl-6-hydroxy-3-cyclohexene-1-carboxylate synthase; Short=SEPHCHC synthase; AltName: Full=Menaquinone biosynthesis protein MenD [Roseiflexus castenholzii DSM 13941]ABU60244.1 2-succinyl-6-hydroxy-2,4-cyclohexadiene-1-carboxylic acid synthase/2-oxoglutarate decarboxylase [Roseiflexus castenholzii DSM 13941]